MRGRAQAISILVRRKDVASANGLGPSAMNDRCPGDQRIALDGPQVVDLELGSHHIGPQHAAACEGESIVRGIADDSPMDESMLLPQLVSNRNPEFSIPVRKVEQLGAPGKR